jgi:hypothetical protein
MDGAILARTMPRGGNCHASRRPPSAWRAHYPEAHPDKPWNVAHKPRPSVQPLSSWVNPEQAALDKRRTAVLELVRRQRKAASEISRARMAAEAQKRMRPKPLRHAASGESRQRVAARADTHLLAERQAAVQSRGWWSPCHEKPAVQSAEDFLESELGAWFLPPEPPCTGAGGAPLAEKRTESRTGERSQIWWSENGYRQM